MWDPVFWYHGVEFCDVLWIIILFEGVLVVHVLVELATPMNIYTIQEESAKEVLSGSALCFFSCGIINSRLAGYPVSMG